MKLLQERAIQVFFLFGIALTSLLAMLVISQPVYAQMDCGEVRTSVINCADLGGGEGGADEDGSHIFGLIIMAINIMTAGIGVVAVGGLVYGALLYTAAGDKQDQVQKAIGIIKNVIIGLIGYAALFAFAQYLIPGGVFN